MASTALDVAGTVLLGLGLSLATVGVYGMLRRVGIFEQLHAAGLVSGPAVVLILLAAVATDNAEIVTSALLVVAFVLVTSSLSSHAIARAAYALVRTSGPAHPSTASEPSLDGAP